MKEITLPAPKNHDFPPPKWWTTTFENAWQYRQTWPLKISNSPFRINGFAHKRTSPIKKCHSAFSPAILINNLYWECPAIKGDLFLDHKEQSISNNFLYAQNGLARPPKNLSWLFPSQMMNSYVQECLMILLDIFRQRMKHSTSNYCYFAQNNDARLKKIHHDPSPFKKWTTEFEWQDNFTHRMSNFWHLPLNGEWRMANVLLTSQSPLSPTQRDCRYIGIGPDSWKLSMWCVVTD